MNLDNYERLRPKYKRYFELIVLSAIALCAYPTWLLSEKLAVILDLDIALPISSQENGWFWVLGFLLIGALLFILSCILISTMIAIYKGWTIQQTLDYFVRYENLPNHWYKP